MFPRVSNPMAIQTDKPKVKYSTKTHETFSKLVETMALVQFALHEQSVEFSLEGPVLFDPHYYRWKDRTDSLLFQWNLSDR